MEERLTALETHVTHQEHLIQELNEVVYHQQLAIDRLAAQLEEIKVQLQVALPSLVKDEEEEEPPPHY